jgi:hypothetical protein
MKFPGLGEGREFEAVVAVGVSARTDAMCEAIKVSPRRTKGVFFMKCNFLK